MLTLQFGQMTSSIFSLSVNLSKHRNKGIPDAAYRQLGKQNITEYNKI